METSIIERKLSDGSTVYAVVFVEGSDNVTIECVDQKAAIALSEAIKEHASYATIEAHRS